MKNELKTFNSEVKSRLQHVAQGLGVLRRVLLVMDLVDDDGHGQDQAGVHVFGHDDLRDRKTSYEMNRLKGTQKKIKESQRSSYYK